MENATLHCRTSLLLRADIENFSPPLRRERLFDIFIKLGLNAIVAEAISKFVTIDNQLPLGLNASPMLAHLACLELDNKLDLLAKEYGCQYSRYSDDIAISGANILPSKDKITKILIDEGFFYQQVNSKLQNLVKPIRYKNLVGNMNFLLIVKHR